MLPGRINRWSGPADTSLRFTNDADATAREIMSLLRCIPVDHKREKVGPHAQIVGQRVAFTGSPVGHHARYLAHSIEEETQGSTATRGY
tara:strand:+ start:838 stop:1104 length:267 start_codon:yes stop_codon:yes gene_type:complete